jgi:hypothetical protein
MVIHPRSVFVTISETTKIPTLNVYRNCEGKRFRGWLMNSLLFVFSHVENLQPPACRLQVTVSGVFPYSRRYFSKTLFTIVTLS